MPAIFSGCCIRFSLLIVALLSVLTAATCAFAGPYYALPGAVGRETPDALTLTYEDESYSYAAGLGWLDLEPGLSAPLLLGGRVYLQHDVLVALQVTLPRLTGVRASGGGTVRVVVDFGVSGAEGSEQLGAQLEPLRAEGTATPERPLTLRLPPLLLPRTLPERLEGLTLKIEAEADVTTLKLEGPAGGSDLSYTVFPLRDPTRLVVDVAVRPGGGLSYASGDEADAELGAVAGNPDTSSDTEPDADARLDAREALLGRLTAPAEVGEDAGEGVRDLGGGATLRSFSVPTLAGSSTVNLVEIAPNQGRFRVQGGSYDLRTPSELTGGALIGLNASYFDPESGRSIGFLKERGGLESLPSRGRAAVGFGFGRPLIGRPEGVLRVRVDGAAPLELNLEDESVTLHTAPGAWVGSPRQGAVVVSATGRVLENKIGPRRVPVGGYVLSYLPQVRPLALIDAGSAVEHDLITKPGVWRFVPEAVEAGPLLVSGGRSAYAPADEAFDPTDQESNVSRRTTRAALGVRADGTVLLLVGTQLTAAELVPIFLDLDAESALQLDSGGSSTLVVDGVVINRPALLQRRVATVITYTPAFQVRAP